jgi:hypothetical protein
VAPELATDRPQTLRTQLVGRGRGFDALGARLGVIRGRDQLRVEISGRRLDFEVVFGGVFGVFQSILLRG